MLRRSVRGRLRRERERGPRAARSIPPRSPGARPPPPGHRWRDSAPGDPRLPSRPPGDRDDLLREHGAADQRARPRALGVSRQAVRYGSPGRAYRGSRLKGCDTPSEPGGGRVVALDNVSFSLEAGQTLAIFGPIGERLSRLEAERDIV